MELLEAARKLIAIDSTPSGGTLEIAHVAAELCRQAGLHVEIQAESHNGLEQANIIARPIESRPENELLLQTHLDTVDPGPYALWTHTTANPFNACLYQDRIYGLGAAEAKLDFLCKLRAIQAIGKAEWKTPFVLVGTFGEELGMPGAIKLVRKKKISSRLALVGEPTLLRPVCAGKGLAVVEIEVPFSPEEIRYRETHDALESASTQSKIFKGRAAHSSDPDLGESAIRKLFEYLGKLPPGLAIMAIEAGVNHNTVPVHAMVEFDTAGDLKDTVASKLEVVMGAIAGVEQDFSGYPEPGFQPPCPTLNIGMIRTYADHIRLSGSCRLPPSVSQETYELWMNRLRHECWRVGALFRITDYKQPFRTSESSDIVRITRQTLEGMNLPSECTAQSAVNEANVFSRLGIECMVIGPGRGVGNSHSPNEHVKIQELEDATEFYRRVIQRVCL